MPSPPTAERGSSPLATIEIPPFGAAPAQPAVVYFAPAIAPLIVDLHTWSATEQDDGGSDRRLDEAVRNRGWHFVRPRLSGPNDNPAACCSGVVLDGIRSAIAYAETHATVDRNHIYIVGASGGGYTALCAYMAGIPVTAYFAWAPISDLVTWHAAHASDKYGRDVRQCTRSGDALNVDEARKRSPIYWNNPEAPRRLSIFAGVHDGADGGGNIKRGGSVMTLHSIRFFNRITGSAVVDDDQVLALAEHRRGPDTDTGRSIGGRALHLQRSSGHVSVSVFEGGHEMLVDAMLDMIKRDIDAE